MLEFIVEYITAQPQQDVEMWLAALLDPKQYLAAGYQPSKEQFVAGLKFYGKIVAVSLVIFAFVAWSVGKGSRMRMLALATLTIIFFFVYAMAVHVPFWLLGGKATFLGTCMAYIYGAKPYMPFLAIANWVLVAAMPLDLRPFALDPARAGRAGELASQHPETDKGTAAVGVLIGFVTLILGIIAMFRCIKFVHQLDGWLFWTALVLCFALFYPIHKIMTRMSALLHDESKYTRLRDT